jgi:hypothetical protein
VLEGVHEPAPLPRPNQQVAGLCSVVASVASCGVAAPNMPARQADTEPALDPALLAALGARLGDRLEATQVLALVAPMHDGKALGTGWTARAIGARLGSWVHRRFDLGLHGSVRCAPEPFFRFAGHNRTRRSTKEH